MTPDEFRTRLLTHGEASLIEACLTDDAPPFAFDPEPESWDEFRDDLVSTLGVAKEDIRIVGSGRFGFSTKPGTNLRRFSDKSDIDMVVVNAALFDQIWLALLEAFYPRYQKTGELTGWLANRRDEIYLGWIMPDAIDIDLRLLGARARHLAQLKAKWFNALKLATQFPPRRFEDLKGRLYRSWAHAAMYHTRSLSVLRQSLQQ